MTAGVTGIGLWRELKDYLDRTGMRAVEVTREIGLSDSTFGNLPRSAYPRVQTVNAVRSFIAAHPNGLTTAADNRPGGQSHGAAALEEAKRNSLPPARPATRAVQEAVATALVETPGDLITTIKRRWPEHWAAILAKARAVEASPAEMLDRVISRGLETVA